jgi:aryl-alcohol dehydrogenase-like predicted oxidoreductase
LRSREAPVETREIGTTGVHVSVVGLGGYEFEDDVGWAGARDIVEAALGAGTNWIDTSEAYFDHVINMRAPGQFNEVVLSFLAEALRYP